MLTFNGAYVNGDDILPLARLEFQNAFVPNFKREWVPNRMLDGYGRDLLAAGFDLWFFSLRTVLPADFSLLFKAYVATIHAAFLTAVLCYIDRAAIAANSPVGRFDHAVIWCFLAVVVLGLFPWRNQTYFVAYQLAAFLCFVLLNEVTRLLVSFVRGEDRDDPDSPALAHQRYGPLILLSFICAFSLEAYAAIILVSMLLPCALVVRGMFRARRTSVRDDASQARLLPIALVTLVTVVFCGLAVVTALASSERAAVAPNDGGFVFSGLGEGGVAWLSSRRGVIAVLLCAIPVGIAALLGWKVLDNRVHNSGTFALNEPRERRRDPQTWIYLSAMAVVVISSAMITLITSIRAGFDYFSPSSYPWGAFLIIAKLFATCTVVLLALSLSKRSLALRGAIVMLAFMAASKGALDVLGTTYASHHTSEQLRRIYVTLGTADSMVTDSGLDLASIPMQARPLPTIDSPEWFVAAFERFREKYFGVSGRTIFK